MNKPKKIKSNELSYVLQQIDTEGSYDITRPCNNAKDFVRLMRQHGVTRILPNQRIIKRIEIPINVPCFEVDDEN